MCKINKKNMYTSLLWHTYNIIDVMILNGPHLSFKSLKNR